jgi:hypothetical protein
VLTFWFYLNLIIGNFNRNSVTRFERSGVGIFAELINLIKLMSQRFLIKVGGELQTIRLI